MRIQGRRWLAVLALVVSSGCGEAARRSVASVDEYSAYRRYRVAMTPESKLAAGFDYLFTHPEGRWRRDVTSWFDDAQLAYVDAAWNNAPKLRQFIAAVPKGENAERAAARVIELELAAAHRAHRERRFDEHVRGVEERLERARAGRKGLVRGFVDWTARLSAIRTWGVRTHELDHELIYAYRLSPPEGRCVGDRCVKPLALPYAIPEERAQSERVALMDVVLEIENGGVERFIVTGPELFTRLGEAIFLKPVLPTDLGARMRCLARVRELVEMTVEATLPAEKCHVEAVSPVLLHRRCEGSELMLVAATELDEEDRLIFQRVAR